jgi:hypothetical protein
MKRQRNLSSVSVVEISTIKTDIGIDLLHVVEFSRYDCTRNPVNLSVLVFKAFDARGRRRNFLTSFLVRESHLTSKNKH